ncbi:probable sodium/metabolite cotransporter BASS4, chloroplastic isoform X2 [Salvia splendens]|uniref:probable sodium/metabolite cotransporter BASS4, chloroplastic isoform X2 n=1 Tax=Salvia splendens TaxID=180675 RepID=UPI001C267BFD|nr:probable sodium/metabolite cotransporter BASS4, chloroplastic isoform X2 [Salvia splendens]
MARALQALIPNHPVTGIPYFRYLSQISSHDLPPFPHRKANVAPLLWELRSVHRIRSIRASAKSLEGNEEGEGEKRLPEVASPNWTKSLAKIASDNFLPLALICGVLLGLANPGPGCLADKLCVSKISTFGIFVISGLTLRSDEIGAATEAWPVGLFGLASILFFTPLFSKIILMLNLQPQEFVTGLAIFCCMPTTLSSGVALTRLAGGNSALALAMTLVSNLLGILIIPYAISKLIATGVGVAIPTEKLLKSLVLTLLVPLILGKVARELSKGIADFVDGNRKLLAAISAIFLSSAPWIQVSRSRSLLLMVKPGVFLVAVVLGVILHLALFSFNALLIPSLSLITGGSKSPFTKKENTSALLLVASQKTLPVMIAVVEQLGGALGASGLLVLPCVAAHLNQIIIDSFIVSLWKQKESSFENAKIA